MTCNFNCQHSLDYFQWVQRVEKGQKDFENISATVRKEIARFDRLRVADFKTSVIKYLEVLMDKQQQVHMSGEARKPMFGVSDQV